MLQFYTHGLARMDVKIEPFLYEKSLVFTVTSDGYKYYTWNLYKILQALKLPWKLCILCVDRESFDFFNRIAQIPSRPFLMPGERIVHKSPVPFGSNPFKRITRMKLKALEQLSQRSDIETLVYLDSDISVFKDPLPYLKEQLLTNPLLFQCDEGSAQGNDCSAPTSCPNPCTGVIAMTLTPETRPQLKMVFEIVSTPWNAATTDQDYVATRLLTLNLPYGTLSRTLFPNGTFLANNKYKEGDPFLLHFNYMVGSKKMAALREKDCWTLPEYVQPGLL